MHPRVLTFVIIVHTSFVYQSLSVTYDVPCGSKIKYSEPVKTYSVPIHRCSFVLEAKDLCKEGIILSVTNFYGDYYSRPTNLHVHDGPNSSYSRLSYNGNYNYRSTSNQMMVSSPHGQSFRFSFTTYNKENYLPPTNRECKENSILNAGNREAIISSPGYPSQYPNSLRCPWIIVATDSCNNNIIKIHVENLELENHFDFLRIYEGQDENTLLAAMTGEVRSRTIYSTKPRVKVLFSSDSRNQMRGFTLTYKQESVLPIFLAPPTFRKDANAWTVGVHFFSAFSLISIVWRLNDTVLDQNEVSEIFSNQTFSQIELRPDSPKSCGTYKILLQNKYGFSEQYVFVPLEYTGIQFIGETDNRSLEKTGYINVAFIAPNGYRLVEWFQNGSSLSRQRYTIRKESGTIFNTSLIYAKEQVESYGHYQLRIHHTGGTATKNLFLPYPQMAFPSQPSNIVFYRDDNHTKIVAEFSSPINNPSASVTLENQTVAIVYAAGGDTNKYHLEASFSNEFSSANQNVPFVIQIENAAGVSSFRGNFQRSIVSDTSLSCYQGNKVEISCNLKNICGAHVIHWLHSVNGRIVRRLQGRQQGLVNVLDIDSCIGADSGTYTCVIEAIDKNNQSYSYRDRHFTGFQHGSLLPDQTIMIVDGLPAMEIMHTFLETGQVELQASIFSHSLLSNVQWFKAARMHGESNRIGLNAGKLRNQSINITSYSKKLERPGYLTSVVLNESSITNMTGRYGLEVKNEVGLAVIFYDLRDPREGIPEFYQESPQIIYHKDLVTVKVLFASNPIYDSVIWTKDTVELEEGEKHCFHAHDEMRLYNTSENSNNRYRYIAELNITDPEAKDAGRYNLKITNRKGFAEIAFDIRDVSHEPPIVHGNISTTQNESWTNVHIGFTSVPNYSSLEWNIDDKRVKNGSDHAKFWVLNNGSKLHINSEGNATRLRVRIQNEFGYFNNEMLLNEECPIEDQDA